MFGISVATLLVLILLVFDHFVTQYQYQSTNGKGLYLIHYKFRKFFVISALVLAFLIQMQYLVLALLLSSLVWIMIALGTTNAADITDLLNKEGK